MERKQAPRPSAGIPLPLDMTERYDISGGRAATAWGFGPETLGFAVRQVDSARNIPNARNAIISADAKRALVDCGNRNFPDRSHEFIPVWPLAQIDLRGEWVGSYRVVGRSPGNGVPDKGRAVFKWGKYKARRTHSPTRRRFGACRDSTAARKRQRNRYCLSAQYPLGALVLGTRHSRTLRNPCLIVAILNLPPMGKWMTFSVTRRGKRVVEGPFASFTA